MFGRLDSAVRLVKIVLNPERLKIVHAVGRGSAAAVLQKLSYLAFAGLDAAAQLALTEGWKGADAQRELAYLDNPGLPVPEYLPTCEELLVRRLHLEILREELDALYSECVQDRSAGAVQKGSGGPAFIDTFNAKIAAGKRAGDAPPRTVIELFNRCEVGAEQIYAEMGTDLFTAISARSLAVALAAGQGQSSGFGPLRAVLKLMRVPALGAYLAARALVLRSRTTAALLAAAFAFSATVLISRAAGWLKEAPSTLLAIAISTTVALFLALAFWRWKLVALLAALALVAGAIYLYFTGQFGWPSWTLETWRKLAVGLAAFLLCMLLPWPERVARVMRKPLR